MASVAAGGDVKGNGSPNAGTANFVSPHGGSAKGGSGTRGAPKGVGSPRGGSGGGGGVARRRTPVDQVQRKYSVGPAPAIILILQRGRTALHRLEVQRR
jgi:hypothetical protein